MIFLIVDEGMGFRNLRSQIGSHLLNVAGWRTNRKIVVIESDDWGSIRMPSKEVYDTLKMGKIDVESDPFNKYDSLETEGDLAALFNVLKKFRDKNGNHPVVTANFVIANPDFKKIKASNFTQYYFELLNETYDRYSGCKSVFEAIRYGTSANLFLPQFHGREHLNISQWLRLLNSNEYDYSTAFNLETYAISSSRAGMVDDNIFAAFDYLNHDEKAMIQEIVNEGLLLFETIFGYKSKSFIAPCYVWDKGVEAIANEHGVEYIQTTNKQYNAGSASKNGYKRRYHYLGEVNEFKQTYLIRNCYFEPSTNKNYDWINRCLKKIEIAFIWGKPAIISMHRLNFIGSIIPENRDKNLIAFELLLASIIKKWPNVEFQSTCQLGEIISNTKNILSET